MASRSTDDPGLETVVTDLGLCGTPPGTDTYLLLLGEDSLAEADWLLVLIHLVVFLIHPLIERISVQNPLCMDLRGKQREVVHHD